ncbi:MAG: hypothetical protein JXK07_11320 [Spirochaetes bacterium]|nr:hypothetical protein [Spirochaetota bacterium]MBN2772456.1 hypothetical protein [Spirochaetota bacterium]
MKKLLSILIFFCVAANAETMFLAGPYGGFSSNTQNLENNIKLEETASVFGLYTQVINPDLFQINNFLYHSPDINDTKITGNHFIADFYPYSFAIGSLAVGAGMNYLSTDTSRDDFTMDQSIVTPYARIGQNVIFGQTTNLRIFPWIGFGKKYSESEGSFTFSPAEGAPSTTVPLESDTDENVFLTGINLHFTFDRYFCVQFKYLIDRNLKTETNNYSLSAILNAYVHKHAGISYRFMYNEYTTGEDIINMVGIFYKY